MGVLALTQPFGVARGVQEPFAIANPAAGSGAAFVCDGRGLRRLLSLVFTLTTDANAANRYVTVEFQGNDANAYCVNAAGVTVAASTTQRFAGTISRGQGEWASGSDILYPLESLFLYPGDTLRVVVAAIQAGDTLTKIRGVMERFPLDSESLPERVD